MVTERLVPFDDSILSGRELAWALNNLVSFVAFLGEHSNAIHGNLQSGALFMTEGHELKVVGLHWLSSTDSPDSPIAKYRTDWERTLPFRLTGAFNQPAFSVDCRFLGHFLSAWSGRIPPELSRFGNHWQSPSARHPPSKFLSLEYWQHDNFVEYLTFLKELPLKDAFERDTFFRSLLDNITNFSVGTQTVSILPHLITALSFSPGPSLLGAILTIGRQLDEAKFASIVIPPVVSLFENRDRHLRLHLLGQINDIVPFVTSSMANDQIFVNIVGGLDDPSIQLKHATIIAMVPLARFLSSSNIDLLIRELRRLQLDPDPQIRTNAVVCIAKIAEFINDETRWVVLAVCYARAAADPFVPVRKAVVSAYRNSLKYFSSQVIAARVMTVVAPLCIDENDDVRNGALRAMQSCINALNGHLVPQPGLATPATSPARQSPQKIRAQSDEVSPARVTKTRDSGDEHLPLMAKVIARRNAEVVAKPTAGSRDVGGWDSIIWDEEEDEANRQT
jgi:SCY1-like protein 1